MVICAYMAIKSGATEGLHRDNVGVIEGGFGIVIPKNGNMENAMDT